MQAPFPSGRSHVHKHCVVGSGLTGTAACKYLASLGEDVVLVGPSENTGAHGACYDEGRIYRILDPHESWARLAERSISCFQGIEEESGIQFYQESGLLIFGVEDSFTRQTREVAARMKTRLEELSLEEISARFPWLRIPAGTQLGLLQTEKAGHLSPRKLCQAQLRLAARSGATYLDASVEAISREAEGAPLSVLLASGERIQAENVLVAAGVYTSVLPLLPEKVSMSLTGAQALLVEISAAAARDLSGMPSMIYEGETEESCFYLLPPIQYPDGSWLIKIGPSTAFDPPLCSLAEVDAWFRRGRLDPDFERLAICFLQELLPEVNMISRRPLLCVTDITPTQNAYIDLLAPGWGVCTGGNGWAAKSSDKIGNLAAQMMALPSHWGPDPELPRSWFRAVTPVALEPCDRLETALVRVEACGHILVSRVVDALRELTELLSAAPKLRARPERLAARLQARLAAHWGAAPSVLCGAAVDAAWAPAHPFIILVAGKLSVVVVLGA